MGVTEKLLTLVAERSHPEYVGEMQETVLNMICNENQPMPLSGEEIYDALESPGEFLILRLDYDDVARELKERRLAHKFRESLHLLASFEINGESPGTLEDFVKYIHDRLEPSQVFRFGIKRVAKRSDAPVTILFAGILPLNRLEIHMGEKIERLIRENEEHLEPHFKSLREQLSEELGFPVLPLRRRVVPSLAADGVRLVDSTDGTLLCEFRVERLDTATLDIYLLRLYYVLKKLGVEWKSRQNSTV